MCGIMGYTGNQSARVVLLEGLANLEYRGYDSAGISFFAEGAVHTIKRKGRLSNLKEACEGREQLDGTVGIGHTRWATHGGPSSRNAHPHTGGLVTLVHNGIIENEQPLRHALQGQGCAFASDTDTEAAAWLLNACYQSQPSPRNPIEAIAEATAQLQGSYAFTILFHDRPDELYALRKDSPLVVGLSQGENYVASDIPAILHHTRSYYLLEDYEIAKVMASEVTLYDLKGNPIEKEVTTIRWDMAAAQKGGYAHFMIKEIHEQPSALHNTIDHRIREGIPNFTADGLPQGFFNKYSRVHMVACGTAMHAAMAGKYLIEGLARLPVEVDVASEFRYKEPILNPDSLLMVVSQSGETADTLAALRLGKEQNIDTVALVNVVGSTIAREADHVLYTNAGPEIAVASTKAYSVQLGVMYLLAIAAGMERGLLSPAEGRRLTDELSKTITKVSQVIDKSDEIADISKRYKDAASLFYIGRGLDYPLAMEGSLKLKEISYIHSEAYAAGELKHGAISLVTEEVPLVALCTQERLQAKTLSNIREARARGGRVLLIAKEGMEIEDGAFDDVILLPETTDLFAPLLAAVALQLLAYHVAVEKGCDVDKPRNLAKSVTVE